MLWDTYWCVQEALTVHRQIEFGLHPLDSHHSQAHWNKVEHGWKKAEEKKVRDKTFTVSLKQLDGWIKFLPPSVTTQARNVSDGADSVPTTLLKAIIATEIPLKPVMFATFWADHNVWAGLCQTVASLARLLIYADRNYALQGLNQDEIMQCALQLPVGAFY